MILLVSTKDNDLWPAPPRDPPLDAAGNCITTVHPDITECVRESRIRLERLFCCWDGLRATFVFKLSAAQDQVLNFKSAAFLITSA